MTLAMNNQEKYTTTHTTVIDIYRKIYDDDFDDLGILRLPPGHYDDPGKAAPRATSVPVVYDLADIKDKVTQWRIESEERERISRKKKNDGEEEEKWRMNFTRTLKIETILQSAEYRFNKRLYVEALTFYNQVSVLFGCFD